MKAMKNENRRHLDLKEIQKALVECHEALKPYDFTVLLSHDPQKPEMKITLVQEVKRTFLRRLRLEDKLAEDIFTRVRGRLAELCTLPVDEIVLVSPAT